MVVCVKYYSFVSVSVQFIKRGLRIISDRLGPKLGP